MAQFEVPTVRVDCIEDHPGADALEIAVVRGYRCVVKIGAHRAGDLSVSAARTAAESPSGTESDPLRANRDATDAASGAR